MSPLKVEQAPTSHSLPRLSLLEQHDELQLELPDEEEEVRRREESSSKAAADLARVASVEKKERCTSARAVSERVRKEREAMLSPSLSLLYEEPLHIVRGENCHLFDLEGNKYLDGVNNVPHVGHSNKRVAEAVSKAMYNLNTNTRYIRSDIVSYSKELLAMFPPSLEIIHFCNSGSEANDLALRIAREAGRSSGRTDVVVMNGAYHGHTASCIDISPYKFDRSGGNGKPETTHIMPFPDTCRKFHMSGDLESKKVLKRAKQKDRKVCAFLSESMLSCGGQVILPDGYLKEVYANMREAGAICIADEVQCGFGRSGSHFWGFQTQGVTPDVVVLGKSIGNGFPLSAVVTTRKLAKTFANGMEYFNTFGGCNAAIAAGHAVLKVLKEEKLKDNADRLGKYVLDALREDLMKYDFVGDVRGKGLFIGIEFVTDSKNLLYAPHLAKYVCNRIKNRRVLLNTDGMHSSVIKIKPPLTFSLQNAKELVATIKKVLADDLTQAKLSELKRKDIEYNKRLYPAKKKAGSLRREELVSYSTAVSAAAVLAWQLCGGSSYFI